MGEKPKMHVRTPSAGTPMETNDTDRWGRDLGNAKVAIPTPTVTVEDAAPVAPKKKKAAKK